MDNFELIYVFPAIIFLFLIFLALRSLYLWYYKINKRVELMEENNKLLTELLKHFTEETENPKSENKENKQN